MVPWAPERYWAAIRDERARLLADLEALPARAWSAPTLCGDWSVEDVVAHLTAGASTGRWAWLRSIVAARFDTDRHNARRLAEHRGPTPSDTLAGFRSVVDARVAPTGDLWAWLGEVVVHGTDIREPLGVRGAPSPEAVEAVAAGYVSRDFAVASRTVASGVRRVPRGRRAGGDGHDARPRHGDGGPAGRGGAARRGGRTPAGGGGRAPAARRRRPPRVRIPGRPLIRCG